MNKRIFIGWLVFLALQFALSLGLEMVIIQAAGGAENITEADAMLYNVLTTLTRYLVAFPVFLLINKAVKQVPTYFQVKTRLNRGQIIRGFLLVCLGSLLFNLLSLHMVVGADMTLTSFGLFTLVIMVTLNPVMEEIMFRGVILRGLADRGQQTAILFSALLFAVAHGDMNTAIMAVLPGFMLGYVAWVSGSIRYTVLMHIAVNIVGQGVLFIAALGFSGLIVAYVITGLLCAGGIFVLIRSGVKKLPLL